MLLYSDSTYLVETVVKVDLGAERVVEGSRKGMAANTEHWTDLLDAVALHEDVEFHLCKGHSGVEGNVIADRLAGLARKEALGLWGQAA